MRSGTRRIAIRPWALSRSVLICAVRRSQHLDRTGNIKPGLLVVQEQLRQADFGELQRTIPGGAFQYLEPSELCGTVIA